MNLLNYLRHRQGLSQQELAAATKLTANDICRFEHSGNISMQKVLRLADYFRVTVDAILTNDFNAIVSSLLSPVRSEHRASYRLERLSVQNIDLGRRGEDWVLAQEIAKLEGTCYENAVNPNYADDVTAGFDILSFDQDGTPVMIEVKTTTGDAENSFYLTSEEYICMQNAAAEGIRYEIHRVHHFDSEEVGRIIISAEAFLKEYTLQTSTFIVHRCKEAKQ